MVKRLSAHTNYDFDQNLKGGEGGAQSSSPKLKSFTKNTFYWKNNISFDFRSKNATTGSKARLSDILFFFNVSYENIWEVKEAFCRLSGGLKISLKLHQKFNILLNKFHFF